MTDLTSEWKWSKPWVAAWAVNVASWIGLVFILEPRMWAVWTALAFGAQEGFALWHGARNYPIKLERYRAPYPPLTYVTRYYLPRWACYSAYGGTVGGLGASVTAGLPRPAATAIVLGLFAWLVEHFELTYREMPRPR